MNHGENKTIINESSNIFKSSFETLKPLLLKMTIAIIVIAIFVGTIMFFEIMPGMVLQEFKKFSNELANYVATFFGEEIDTYVDSHEIFNTVDYIENMGYDLKGFGFLTDYYKTGDEASVKIFDSSSTSGYEVDEQNGVIRDSEKRVALAKTDFLFTYIISDSYIYTLKNANISDRIYSKGSDKENLENSFLLKKFKDLLEITQSAKDAWGKGFLNIYEQGGQIGVKGSPYTGNILVDTGKKEIIIKGGEYLTSNEKVEFNLDGWSGKYGMPAEFLLSVHLATMMPDLAYDLATKFPTEANIILNPVKEKTTYQPYVVDIRNRWYRDIYYVIDLDEFEKNDTELVAQEDGFQSYYNRADDNERWTAYCTYTIEDTSPEYKDYAEKHLNEFKLFVLNSDGEFATADDISKLEENDKIKKYDKTSYIYLGTKEEASADGVLVSKRPLITSIDNEDEYEEMNWNKIGSIWSAYQLVPMWDGDIKQTGEGLIAETNPGIKKMFLQNTYFRYDGSPKSAEIITALRNRIKNEFLPSNINEYGALNALITSGSQDVKGYSVPKTYDFTETDAFNKTFTASELGLDNLNKDIKLSDYTGQVSLSQDALNIFTMLENIHTIDADYVYRDFKELMVELGYFDKEEIADTTPRLLEFPIPSIASVNYPGRDIDKREIEFGTMVHSKGDIDASQAYNGTKILDTIPTNIPIKSPDRTHNGYYNRLGKSAPGDMFIVPVDPVEHKINGTNDELAEQAKTMWLQMGNLEDGIYYTKANNDFAKTFQETLDDPTKRKVNDAVFVSWILKKFGADVDSLVARFDGDWTKPHDVTRICIEDLGAEIIFNYRDLQQGDILAYIYDDKINTIQHIDVLGEQSLDGSFAVYGCGELPNPGDTKAKERIDENEFNRYSLCFGMRLGEDEYEGYIGNEMVVSPVTGVLLEYGTYDETNIDSITHEQYRVNVDLKYGPVTTNEEAKGEQYTNKIVSDKVGYAKILVLDMDNYLYLEQSTENRWNENNGGRSLANKDKTFREELADDGMSTAVEKVLGRADDHSYDDSMRWSKLDQNIYAYKEFVEKYEEAGIAGYIIYIDGFVPEKPDENLKSTEIMDKIPYENNPSGKQNAKISIDESSGGGLNYKQVKISNLDDPLAQLPSQYIEETYSEVASERGNNKYKAESLVKYLASGSIYLDNIVSDKLDTDSLIFIKEGTILGRTMTDKELLESSDFRSNETGTYKENREVSLEINKEGADIIIGNYIRVMMRDHDKTIVENIEDFYKLGDKEDYSWFEILFWVPYESDGVDVPLGGPECVSTCTPGELAVGIAQWTDLLDHYHEGRDGNGINSVLRRCVKNDYDLCWPLEEQIKGNVERWCETTGDEFKTETNPHYEKKQISAKTGKEFDGLKGKFDICIKREPDKDLYGYGYDYNGEVIPEAVLEIHCRWDGHEDLKAEAEENIRKSPLQEALSKVCKMNREKFFKLQRQLAKESFLDPILLEHPWLEDRPLCVQGALMHTYLAGDQTMKWLDESQTNEEILQCVRHYIAHRKSTAGDDGNKSRAWSEPEIAYKLLDGTLSKYEVEVWTRESTSQILEAAGMKFKGTYDD